MLFKVNALQAEKHILTCFQAGIVPFLKGSPGIGKSSIFKSIADQFNLELIDIRLSAYEPSDINGLPNFEGNRAKFVPFDVFPLEDTPLPEGKSGWLVLLDELNSAHRDTLAAAYPVILDRMIGTQKLNDAAVVAAAGNLETDNAIVNNIGTALQSRMAHLQIDVDLESWVSNVAIPQKYDPRIMAYLNYMPSKLSDFRPDHTDQTYACPRSWEFVNSVISNEGALTELTPLLAGIIGTPAALDFVKFTEIYDTLVKVEDIVKDPNGLAIPTGAAERWGTLTHLVSSLEPNNFSPCIDYINRFPVDFKILAARMIIAADRDLPKDEKLVSNHPSVWARLQGGVAERMIELGL